MEGTQLKLINLSVDGRPVQVSEGTTIMQAAMHLGIHVPHLCYHPLLKSTGSCRMCVVEVEGARGLLAACTTPATEGMVVSTDTPALRGYRKTVLELLWSNHSADCLTCEGTGTCRLQQYSYEYGIDPNAYPGERRRIPVDGSNPFFIRDYEKCILCGRCVRMCHDVQGAYAIDFVDRGFEAVPGAPFGKGLQDSTCVFCGNCITVCPVGALVAKSRLGKGRPWQVEKVRTICSYCGVGCAVELEVRDGRVIGVLPADGPANHNLLCVKGRFGWEYIHAEDRLTKPLIRREGVPKDIGGPEAFREATWEEALDMVAAKIAGVRDAFGADSVAGLSSAKCTNEENYLFQKILRAGVGTNNIDHCARL